MKNALFFFFTVCLFACQPDNKQASTTPTPAAKPAKQMKVPKFDKDAAYNFVAEQVAFGPRVPNSEGHKACKEYLVGKLKEFKASVIEQDFKAQAYTGTTLNGTNIIGQFNPSAKKRIVLAAHWDTRHITDNDPDESRRTIENLGVDIVFFDAEDYGNSGEDDRESWALGSQHWSSNFHVKGYRADYGILLDMVGGKNARMLQTWCVRYGSWH